MSCRYDCNCKGDRCRSLELEVEALGRQMRHLFTLIVAHASLDPTDQGQRNRSRQLTQKLERIMGGRPVPKGTFAECCLIGNSSGGGHISDWFCTGALIHPRLVVTADHCVLRPNGVPDPNSIAIGIEEETDVDASHIRRVLRAERHPTEDLALLILQKPAEQDPVEIATAAECASAERVELVGFGNTDPVGTLGFGTKRQASVPVHFIRKSPKDDLRDVEQTFGFSSCSEFVAGRKGGGKDSCKGDKGGLAYIFAQDGSRKLAGMTSRATDEADDACGDKGIYVRLDVAKPWIASRTPSL